MTQAHNQPIVHIWGAGVDKPLGMPLARELLTEVADFSKGDGAQIAKALRGKLPNLRFNFDKYTGEQGETFAERVLMGDPQELDRVKGILDRYITANSQGEEPTAQIQAVRAVVGALEQIRDHNKLEDDTLESLAHIGGVPFQPSGGDFVFDPKGLHMTPVVREAFRKTFQGLTQNDNIIAADKEVLNEMALAMMDAEELLGTLFSGFYTKRRIDQRQYLFVGWLCWAYLRVKMEQILVNGRGGLYGWLEDLPDNHRFITLNYTASLFPETVRERVNFFHGDCLSYIRVDTRDLITNDGRVLDATTPETIAGFIEALEMDVDTGRVSLPGIVPPLSVKPVICREHLDTWYECGQLIDQAISIVITGYSFNRTDEHLNDLIRKRRGGTDTRIVVINSNIDAVVENVCSVLGQDARQLTDTIRANLACKQTRNLLFVEANTQNLTREILDTLLD